MDDTDLIRDLVLGYLAARETWERGANRDFDAAIESGSRKMVVEAIESEYRQLATDYFHPDLLSRLEPVSFGDPPGAQLSKTRINSIDVVGPDRAIVKTTEPYRGPDGAAPYEYEVLRIEGRWRLWDRRMRHRSGWFRGLL